MLSSNDRLGEVRLNFYTILTQSMYPTIKAGDVVAVREIRKDNGAIKANVEQNSARPVPEWLEKDEKNLSGKVVRLASREEVDIPVEEHLIVELYSK